jgi:rhomboid protease GluP
MAQCVQCGRQLPGFSFGKKKCSWCVQHEAAQRGEVSDVQRVEPAPWARQRTNSMMVTHLLIGINVAVFVLMVANGVSLSIPTAPDLVRWGANFGPLTIAGQWWRLLSCVFVHIGILHIALNMYCLWGLGRLAEPMFGDWTFAAVYLITGVSASVASLAWRPAGISAGASGAIFGIAGALITSLYVGRFAMPDSVVAGLRNSVLKFAGYNLVLGAFMGRVDNAAHVGGLVSGLILGALLARVAPNKDDASSRIAVLSVGVVLALAGAYWVHHTYAHLLPQVNLP